MITFGSGCSGIESASMAWHPLGWRAAWFAEIEPFPKKVLAHRWPNVTDHGDFMTLRPKIERGEIIAPDVFVAGTPCQAFSVAGARKGLDDERGQLTLEYVRIADAIDQQRKRLNQPECVCVWENVPGVLSDKSNAFGCFIAGLAGEDVELIAPGGRWSNAGVVVGHQRTVAWRILDAQYFGVAQRRRRVFVVASARKGFDPIAVLFEFDGLRRDSAPSRETGKAIAPILASSAGACGADVKDAQAGHLIASDIVGALDTECGFQSMNHQTLLSGHVLPFGFRMTAFGEYSQDNSASCMKARDWKDATDLVVSLDQEHTGALTAGFSKMGAPEIDAYTAIPMVSSVYGIPGNWVGRAPENGGNATTPMVNVAPCQTRNDRHAVAYTVHGTQDPDVKRELAHTMGRNWGQENAMIKGYAVRRLTPRECERLQGFPDDYTNVPGASDGARYKALGNSKAVPVVRWIGQRIAKQIGGGDEVEEIEAKVNTILNSLGLGLLFDVAQTLAWERARDFPNDDDYRAASEMIERWQTARKLTGAKPL